MKLILILVFLCFISIKTIAKNSDSLAFNAGKIILYAGYGFPNIDKAYQHYLYNGRYTNFKSMGYGPFHFRAEYGLSDKIAIGISINLNSYGGTWKEVYRINDGLGSIKEYTYNYKKKITSLTGLIRFNYHVFTTKKLDPYFAFGAGFKSIKNTFSNGNDPNILAAYNKDPGNDFGFSDLPAAFEAVAGLRYYVTPHIGIYSEMGMAKSIIQFGLSVGF